MINSERIAKRFIELISYSINNQEKLMELIREIYTEGYSDGHSYGYDIANKEM